MRRRVPGVRLGRTVIVLQIVAAVAFVAYLLHAEGVRAPFVSDSYEITAEFSDATGLKTSSHAPVTVAGVPIGRVDSVELDGGVAVAKLRLDSDAEGRVFEGASARIVPRSALQDLFVDISPGDVRGEPLPDGAKLPAGGNSATVGADRVLSVLDADTRAQIQVLLDQLEAGLHGRSRRFRGDLAQIGSLVDSASQVTGELARRRTQLSRLVGGLDAISTELAERRNSLGGSIDVARRTLAITADRDDELARTMRGLPSTLQRVEGSLDAVGRLGEPLTPALARLRPLARKLPGTLGALRRFAPDGEQLISDAGRLGIEGKVPLAHLKSVASELQPASRGLLPPVQKLLPVVQAVDKNKDGIGRLGDNFSGVFSINDLNGPILRGLGFFENIDPANLGFPSSAPGETTKARADAADALDQICLKLNPLACLVRYLVPGLPGSVAPAGSAPEPEASRAAALADGEGNP